jgi:UDP-N-acetylglucosamine--N-acetylmuramyl-(pentapeptide) pyrophosphoryl-undecaprenol N-acetylglucosamine transferase
MPAKYYSYPKRSIRVVGVPVDQRFTEAYDLVDIRNSLEIPLDAVVLLVTGGSNGARRMNASVLEVLPELFEAYPSLYVIHQYGAKNEDQFDDISDKYLERMKRFDFTKELFKYSAVSDIIVTRAGASAIADFASQGKACILIPNPDLVGGHQMKNAAVYEDQDAALIVHESALKDSVTPLYRAIELLITHPKKRDQLAKNIQKTLPTEPAARAIARILTEVASK